MKGTWEAPRIMVQEFEANEYVAACGDSGKVYKFKCDAGSGAPGSVYLETNGQEGLQTGSEGDEYLSTYHACGTEHEADAANGFLNGYYVTKDWWTGETTVTPVIVWRGPNNDNTHCTTNLNISSWETAKS